MNMLPRDMGHEFELVKFEEVVSMPVEPIFTRSVRGVIEELVLERRKAKALEKAGLSPSGKVLFKGPPGVGKTLGARFLARALSLPLVTMDLSTIVNCYLGETAKNLKRIFDYGCKEPCVFFLDEIDAIAISRAEHGRNDSELRRVVNALLQRMDNWGGKSVMLAATNTAELCDPAVLRRFDHVVAFPLPDGEMREQLCVNRLKKHGAEDLAAAIASAMEGESYAAIDFLIQRALRRSIVKEEKLRVSVGRVLGDYAAA